jgi:hypothetical protein
LLTYIITYISTVLAIRTVVEEKHFFECYPGTRLGQGRKKVEGGGCMKRGRMEGRDKIKILVHWHETTGVEGEREAERKARGHAASHV